MGEKKRSGQMITSQANARASGSKPGASVEHLRMMAGVRSERIRRTSTPATRVQNSTCDAEPTASIASVTGTCCVSKATRDRHYSIHSKIMTHHCSSICKSNGMNRYVYTSGQLTKLLRKNKGDISAKSASASNISCASSPSPEESTAFNT